MREREIRRRLSPEESTRFERDGYVLIPDTLDPDEVRTLDALAHELEVSYYEPPTARRRWGRGRRRVQERPVPLGRNVEFHDVLHRPPVLDLIDHPSTLLPVADILGWNIAVYLATVMVTPPDPDADPDEVPAAVAGGWHQDSSRVNDDLLDRPRPRLSVKVAYFLTDLTQSDAANMWVLPGSHQYDELPPNAAERGVPLCGPAGTAVIFDRRLWHSASPNLAGHSRRIAFVGYAPRWMRPHDDMNVSAILPTADPLRRQLLGWAPDATSRYAPEDADVPLRALCAELPVGLAADQRITLAESGYLRLPRRVASSLVVDLRAVYDEVLDTEESVNTERLRLLRWAPFRQLLDSAEVLGPAQDMFGNHLQLLDMWLTHQPAAGDAQTSVPSERDWHRDLTFLGADPTRPLMMNMLMFVDDVDEPHGPTVVLPGSHLSRRVDGVREHGTARHADEHAVPLAAGEILFFNSSLVHSRGVNTSPHPRRGVAMLWGPWFVKPVDSHLPVGPGARVEATRERLQIVGVLQPTLDQYLFDPF